MINFAARLGRSQAEHCNRQHRVVQLARSLVFFTTTCFQDSTKYSDCAIACDSSTCMIFSSYFNHTLIFCHCNKTKKIHRYA